MSIAHIFDPYFNRLRKVIPVADPKKKVVTPEPVLRSELFNAEQMAAHGSELAGSHHIASSPGRVSLLPRLDDNERALSDCCRMFSTVAARPMQDRHITPAGEWLLDNYWLIEEQIHIARNHLPKSYSKELPQLADGPSRGLPRVYDIALEIISHGDGRLDMEVLSSFVSSYQTVKPLTLGELWAIPIMLRLALIENLRRVSTRVVQAWKDQDLAVKWSNKLVETAGKDRKSVVLAVAEMAKSNPPVTSPFVAELARRLQGQGAVLALPLNWMEELLAESGMNIDTLIHLDTQQQAADQVSISNSITSLRLLSAVNWRDFVESGSLVEKILRTDPVDVYAKMDFSTRDHYRHVVEALAKRYGLEEMKVAETAIGLARDGINTGQRESSTLFRDGAYNVGGHVGFYLVDVGKGDLKRTLKQRVIDHEGTVQSQKKHYRKLFLHERISVSGYLFFFLAVSILVCWPFFKSLFHEGWGWAVYAAILPVFFVGSQFAVKLINWCITNLMSPRFMSRLDFSGGIPEEYRTLVVVPTMMSSLEEVASLMEKLEVEYLSNPEANLQFGLLTDFKDCPQEVHETDSAVLQAAAEGIERLNEKYPGDGPDKFFLCHRPRVWNDKENCWMGHERKRGKLADFNALASGKGKDKFLLIAGNTLSGQERHQRVRYVITLDTDTHLPRDAAHKLAGAMAHPLNRPFYDPDKKRITAGYAIMQPRVGITLQSANRSGYARIFGSDAGVDQYTRTVSDVYQDLFRQGSYIGKGIYDVEAFEQTLKDRFPENSILSHDLIESCHARSGLVTDVELYEDYPSTYGADVMRRHRWIRGDWQLVPWLFPKVRVHGGKREPNCLSALSCWKLVDNLRRSLVPLSLLTALILGWFVSRHPIYWTIGIAALLVCLPVLDFIYSLVRKPKDIPLVRHLKLILASFGKQALQLLLMVIWLPHEAWYCTDAIVRTLWRVCISKKNLLQWNPSCDTERTSPKTLLGLYRFMAVSPLVALAVVLGLTFYPPASSVSAAPFVLLWLAAPAVAWALSRPRGRKVFKPSTAQVRMLRNLARRTWAYFDHFVGPEDNWLPPDNIQEEPYLIVAHRTSPTNMGMSLLSHLSAADFGYLSAGRLLERLDKTLAAMSGMSRFHNHFYNWYDTRTLEPLQPQYVSTVDSGNLVGALMVLRQGLLEFGDRPVFSLSILEGLNDTVAVVHDFLKNDQREKKEWHKVQYAVASMRTKRHSSLREVRDSLSGFLVQLQDARQACTLEEGGDAEFWFEALISQCREMADEIEAFALPGSVTAGPANASDTVRDKYLDMTFRDWMNLDLSSIPAELQDTAEQAIFTAKSRIELAERLAEVTDKMAYMDFGLLYDRQRDLLAIGYNLNERRMDPSFYDLLASEARLTYYIGVAQGQLPQESWFSVGRLLTGNTGAPALLSWTGSMFEYLMPELIMPSYENSLLYETCRGAVKRQIAYGREMGLPWGISESAYNLQDGAFNYQYKAFGVPGLGLKSGLGEDMVLAPYATVLALMIDPASACANLQLLQARGLSGRFGMYEAIDYTSVRLPRDKRYAIIPSFMSHHQGMSMLSLARLLLGPLMQRRFLSDPCLKSANMLLEERMPSAAPEYLHTCKNFSTHEAQRSVSSFEGKLRIYKDPNRRQPAVQLLSNGRYHVVVTNSGGGYSRYLGTDLSRWRPDTTRDNWGMFCYLRDVESGEFWSTTYQPVCRKTELYEAIFCDARAEFRVREKDYDAHTEIVVSPEDDIELRRVHITNRGKEKRILELTSYFEIVLAPNMADAQHPAFNKLFVQTEINHDLQAILASRRPRSAEEQKQFLFHTVAVHGADAHGVSYETDRSRFIGRGRDLADPAAMHDEYNGYSPSGLLSNSSGSVLDPVAAIRCRLTLEPGQIATVDFVTGVSPDHNGCLQLIEKFRDKRLADRVFDLAWTQSQVLLYQFNASVYDAHLYEEMASSILYTHSSLRASGSVLEANNRGQSGLWGQGISGDNPIVLVRIGDSSNIKMIMQMVRAHEYWRLKGLTVDLVIWNEDHFSYRQNLQDLILSAAGVEGHLLDKPGGIFVRAAQQMSREDRVLIQSAAQLILSDTGGPLSEQIYRRRAATKLPAQCSFIRQSRPVAGTWGSPLKSLPENLILTNSHGGFSPDGTEYVVAVSGDDPVPAPWVNVIANPVLGTIVSESGSAYTWSENAHEFRLTPWQNDPVTDGCGEAIYIRDEESGHYWSPTFLPVRGRGRYLVRHGFGYSVFSHVEDGIESELTVFVSPDKPVKFSLLKLRNVSGRPRKLSVAGYVEWVLGDLRAKTGPHVVTEAAPFGGALLARNGYNMDFPGRVALFNLDVPDKTFSCDRAEFLGRNGSMAAPSAMKRICMSGRAGAGLDPCAALHTQFSLLENQSKEMVFILGAAQNISEAGSLTSRFSSVTAAKEELSRAKGFWKSVLGVIQVETPDQAVNVMANGWLQYQSICSRFFARSGYYQSGGAFGFRDQLQDSMAMVYALPEKAREHLLLSAEHQFVEGDVQHWWHPPTDRGVRTRCSDDYLWLPLAAYRYITVTGDWSVLDEQAHFLEGRQLNEDEESYYDLPMRSPQKATLYEHCLRSLKRGMNYGVHGLPLMGSGDWNDGMDRVGIHGRGESVWLGFFTFFVMQKFITLAEARGDNETVNMCRQESEKLRQNLDLHGWDGDWFRRAYFDDGTPLGTSSGVECRIDSIAQSWSVLSGAAQDARRKQAMESLNTYLVRRDLDIIQLLTPPFDTSSLEPGYIKGYVPGVRENGGQYTHAGIWAAMAFAALGDTARAWELASMLNPTTHGDSASKVERYKVEPYVISADVYAVSPHEGRGGWSWYTGSAAWMYRLLVESLLGFRVEKGHLFLEPLFPDNWEEFKLSYTYKDTTFRITLSRAGDETQTVALVDGQKRTDASIPLVDDGQTHDITLFFPRTRS